MRRIQLCVVCLIVLQTAFCVGKSIKQKPNTCDFGKVTTRMIQLYYTTSVAKNKLVSRETRL